MTFSWPRSREQRRRDAAAEYAESLAVWQTTNQTNTRDLTVEQRERYREWVRAINSGTDAAHLRYGRHLLRSGRING